jgi:hypothetical protein
MVPAPVAGREVGGHRQARPNSAASPVGNWHGPMQPCSIDDMAEGKQALIGPKLQQLNGELSLPIFRLDFIPWRGAAGFGRRSGWHPR